MKYYYLKYRDRETRRFHKGYFSEELVDEIFNEKADDGYNRNMIKVYIGDFSRAVVKAFQMEAKESGHKIVPIYS